MHASPHYFLGAPYQANGFWFYPSESYSLETTGIATVDTRTSGLTADGELRDATLATASMQTLQLPAIVEVTNLDNGRVTLLRVNDRGPVSPGRVIGLSSRAALLLAVPAGGTPRVSLRVDDALSHQVVEQLGGNGQKVAINAAPAMPVQEETLGPVGAARTPGAVRIIGAPQAEVAQARVPDRLPERITQGPIDPGQLWLRAGHFSRFNYARRQAAMLSGLGSDVLRSGIGRQTSYEVRAGPFRSVAEADAALAQALRDGILDARITVE